MAFTGLAAIADATKNLAHDLISSVYFPRVKISFGGENVATDVSAANPFPVAGTVALDAPSLAALETVSVTGTVALDAPSLAALETVTVNGTVTATGPLTDTQLRAAAVLIANDKLGTTTRTPVWASGLHLGIVTASARVGPLTGTEVAISPDTDCYIRIGDSAVVASIGAESMFLAGGSGPHYFQMTTGSYVAAIRKTANGFASVVPVA